MKSNTLLTFLSVVLVLMLGYTGLLFYRVSLTNNHTDQNNQQINKNNQSDTTSTPTPTPESQKQNKKEDWKDKPAHDYQVPILMYHYIRDYTNTNDQVGINLSVSPATFEKHLQWLKEHNYQTFGPSDLEKIAKLDPGIKPIILTFDDGYKDAYIQAFPLLKKYGFTGVFYIIAGSVGDGNYVTWDQIKEMSANGMIIGSHTISHPDLRNASAEELTSQLNGSHSLIKDHTSIEVTDFCYPAGKYNETVINRVKELGYKSATTVAPGLADQTSSPYELPRYRITNESSFDYLFGN